MAKVLTILRDPNPILREPTSLVTSVDDSIRELVDDMVETMFDSNGCGLAAPQIGVSLKLFVIGFPLGDTETDLKVFINPEVTLLEGTMKCSEGCLSIPGTTKEVERAQRVRVKALNEEGKPFELVASGLLAVVIQHENDHLNGILMTDH